jgi:hypothetical protein
MVKNGGVIDYKATPGNKALVKNVKDLYDTMITNNIDIDKYFGGILLKGKITISHTKNESQRQANANNAITKAHMGLSGLLNMRPIFLGINEQIAKYKLQIALPKINMISGFTYLTPEDLASFWEIQHGSVTAVQVYRKNTSSGNIAKMAKSFQNKIDANGEKIYSSSKYVKSAEIDRKIIKARYDAISKNNNMIERYKREGDADMVDYCENIRLNLDGEILDLEMRIKGYEKTQYEIDNFTHGINDKAVGMFVEELGEYSKTFQKFAPKILHKINTGRKDQLLACSLVKKTIDAHPKIDIDYERVYKIVNIITSMDYLKFNLNSVFNSKYASEVDDLLIGLIKDTAVDAKTFGPLINELGDEIILKKRFEKFEK